LPIADRRLQILLVRLRQIGDVVFTTPAVAAIRKRYPDAHLTYLVEPPAAPIVAHNPHLDDVLVVPAARGVGGMLADLTLGRRLRQRQFDLAIDFHGGPRASLLTWLSGARRRIGYEVIGRSWMYTDVIGRPRELRRRHSVLNQWDLLTPLGIDAPTPAAFPMEMALSPAATEAVAARLSAAGVAADDALVVVHVSASSPFRRWPMESFVQMVAGLASHPHRRVIVTSGPSERDAANSVIDGARKQLVASAQARVLQCGDFSLAELRALLERSAVYIGGDSGPLHVAGTTRVPIVALFGPTPSERSAPWRSEMFPVELVEVDGLECRPCDQRVCVPGDFRCLTRIEPARVIAAAERLLGAWPAGRRQEPA
jgi:lipopolysaccharide heptosyltransferase II